MPTVESVVGGNTDVCDSGDVRPGSGVTEG